MKQFSKFISAAMVAAALFFSSSAVFAQANQGVKIGTNPTTKDANSNIEVEPTTTGRTFRLHSTSGQMTYKDGTEGNKRILTSDANGNASWVYRKITSSNIFTQTSGVTLNLPSVPAGTGYCSSPSCGVSLNLPGSFIISETTNDVIINVSGNYSVKNNTTAVSWGYYVIVTGPGGYSSTTGPIWASETGTSCSSGLINFNKLLKDLTPGTYNVVVYAASWKNVGPAAATLGVGTYSGTGCGDTEPAKMIISVSE